MGKILAVSGSMRTASFNTKLLKIIAASAAKAGAEVTMVDLRELPMPFYDGDLEAAEGVPVNALKLRALIAEHQGLLVVSPEYNGSVAAVLKNALDWCSRPTGGQEGLAPFRGKLACLASASVGIYGGVRGVGHMRIILSKMGVTVLPDEVLVTFAGKAFAEDGSLVDPATLKLAEALGANFALSVARMQAHSA
jgi:NAD(P)H-dependent FMN reductase